MHRETNMHPFRRGLFGRAMIQPRNEDLTQRGCPFLPPASTEAIQKNVRCFSANRQASTPKLIHDEECNNNCPESCTQAKTDACGLLKHFGLLEAGFDTRCHVFPPTLPPPCLSNNPTKAVADMDKFPGPHVGGGGSSGSGGGSIIGKSSALAGCYPISPLHVKRRSSSNSNSNHFSTGVSVAGIGFGEDKLEAKEGGGGAGMGMVTGNDNLDGGYLPLLRRCEGRGGESAGC